MPKFARRMAAVSSLVRAAESMGDPLERLRFLRTCAPDATGGIRRRVVPWTLGALLPLALAVPLCMRLTSPPGPPSVPGARVPPRPPAPHAEKVWQIESGAGFETYSNGLRIETGYTTATARRAYYAFALPAVEPVARYEPAGIVYHTTESCQAPFAAGQTALIRRLGVELLEFVRGHASYHYLIDRFGRVYRVVAESDVAFHAGHSVWADDDWLYLDLNPSFIGVAFEAQSGGPAGANAGPAQLRAAAILTEMLRSRYHLAAGNCVTHAQVSVNPSNMRIGYHTDWFDGFPFEALGLPDNYQRPPPALWALGFGYDPPWIERGRQIAAGVENAELQILRAAAAARMPPGAYRRMLQNRYRARLEAARLTPAVARPDDNRSAASPGAPNPPSPVTHKRTRLRAPVER